MDSASISTSVTKALTVKQPWASLVMSGIKTFETRCWETPYRGRIAITSSKTKPPKSVWGNYAIQEALGRGAYAAFQGEEVELPFGMLLGTVELVEIVPAFDVWDEAVNNDETGLGDFFPDTFAWRLVDPRPIEPIPIKGQLGLWNLPVPLGVAGAIGAQKAHRQVRR